MKKGTEPMYPTPYNCEHKGISTRLYLAGMILQGLCANSNYNGNATANAVHAIELTDELLSQEEDTRNE